jgi:YedE family putative selenium metabolism protein
MGFSLGRSYAVPKALGWVMPVVVIGLLVLLLTGVNAFGPAVDGNPTGPIFQTAPKGGPGALHAAVGISLGVGLLIGFLAQRSRFCTVGAIRDLILLKDMHLMNGVLALIVAAFATNAILGQLKFGFTDPVQPVAHADALWNFLGMVLSGLAFTLAGGCPGRQVFLSGEGDTDASVFVLGMIAGAAFAHNFRMASSGMSLTDGVLSPGGVGPYGPAITIIGIIVCVIIGLTMRERSA